MEYIRLILIGLVAGGLARRFVKGSDFDFGVIGDIFVGVLGAFLGCLLLSSLGVLSLSEGLLGEGLLGAVIAVIIATIGAIVLIFILRLIRRYKERVAYLGFAVIAYLDFMVFFWIHRYFSDSGYARSENLLPAFFFSSWVIICALVFWQNMTYLQKFVLILLTLPPAIVILNFIIMNQRDQAQLIVSN